MTSQEADTYNLDWRCHCLLINLKCGRTLVTEERVAEDKGTI